MKSYLIGPLSTQVGPIEQTSTSLDAKVDDWLPGSHTSFASQPLALSLTIPNRSMSGEVVQHVETS